MVNDGKKERERERKRERERNREVTRKGCGDKTT